MTFRTIGRPLIAAGLCAGALAPPAAAAPDLVLTPKPNLGELTWEGTPAAAANVTYLPAGYNLTDAEGVCGKDAATYCEEVLVGVSVAGHLDVRLTDMQLNPSGLVLDDYDLFLYEADAAGTTGALVEKSAEAPGVDELLTVPVRPGHYLARVVYVSTALGGYRGHVALTSPTAAAPATPTEATAPPRVELQLASSRSKRGRVLVRVSNPGPSAVTGRLSAGRAARAKKLQLAGGASWSVTLRLSLTARRTLARTGRLRLRLTATVGDGTGHATVSRTVTVKTNNAKNRGI